MIALKPQRIALALALTLLAPPLVGCGNGPDGAGVLNPNPGTGSSERPAERTDQPGLAPTGEGKADLDSEALTPIPPIVNDDADTTVGDTTGSPPASTPVAPSPPPVLEEPLSPEATPPKSP